MTASWGATHPPDPLGLLNISQLRCCCHGCCQPHALLLLLLAGGGGRTSHPGGLGAVGGKACVAFDLSRGGLRARLSLCE